MCVQSYCEIFGRRDVDSHRSSTFAWWYAPARRSRLLALGAGVAQQDHVGIETAAEDGEGFAVGGPGEAAAALFGSELGDVVAGAAVDRLEPDVVDAVFADGVGERLAGRGEKGRA